MFLSVVRRRKITTTDSFASKVEDATGLSRGISRLLPRTKTEKVSRCHALVAWSLTLFADYASNVNLRRHKAVASRYSVSSYVAANVNTTGQARGIFRLLRQSYPPQKLLSKFVVDVVRHSLVFL